MSLEIEQKGWDRGRWVGTPKGWKQHGHVWVWLPQ